MHDACVFLESPKYAVNVGGVLRACHIFHAHELAWSGTRITNRRQVASSSRRESVKFRLPREERMKAYRDVAWGKDAEMLDRAIVNGFTPVCVELRDHSEPLVDFIHPRRAVYVFGPEDGSVSKGVRAICHRFVRIPGDGPLNLAAASNVILCHRRLQQNWK